MTRRLGLCLLFCVAPLTLHAFDSGQYGDVAPGIRAWFHAQKIPGTDRSCCDEMDGHLVSARGDEARGFEIFVEGAWRKVPPETVLKDSKNPLTENIAWFLSYAGNVRIFCFVPGGGV